MENKLLKLGKIKHYHITTKKNICGGNPIIKGTRTSVSNIAGYYRLGLTPDEIKRELSHLNMAQIFDALAFYFDNQEEIDKEMGQDIEEIVAREYKPCKY